MTREPTQHRILDILLRRGICSRAGLAKMLEISRPGVAAPVERLIASGVLFEDGCGKSGGGKPPTNLRLNRDSFSAIGIDIGSESVIRSVICDASGKVAAEIDAPASDKANVILSRCAKLVKDLSGKAAGTPFGVCAAMPGPVDTERNELISCVNFPLANIGFAGKLSKKCGLPVTLENRAKSAAAWEHAFGSASDTGDFVFISAGRGIGSAFYHDGRLFTGHSGFAGELNSLALPAFDGKGVLPVEDALSEKKFLTLAGAPDLASALKKASGGNKNALAAEKYFATNTGRLIELLEQLFDPEVVVLGGRFRDFGTDFVNKTGPHRATVRIAKGGRRGAALGGALNVITQKFKTI